MWKTPTLPEGVWTPPKFEFVFFFFLATPAAWQRAILWDEDDMEKKNKCSAPTHMASHGSSQKVQWLRALHCPENPRSHRHSTTSPSLRRFLESKLTRGLIWVSSCVSSSSPKKVSHCPFLSLSCQGIFDMVAEQVRDFGPLGLTTSVCPVQFIPAIVTTTQLSINQITASSGKEKPQSSSKLQKKSNIKMFTNNPKFNPPFAVTNVFDGVKPSYVEWSEKLLTHPSVTDNQDSVPILQAVTGHKDVITKKVFVEDVLSETVDEINTRELEKEAITSDAKGEADPNQVEVITKEIAELNEEKAYLEGSQFSWKQTTFSGALKGSQRSQRRIKGRGSQSQSQGSQKGKGKSKSSIGKRKSKGKGQWITWYDRHLLLVVLARSKSRRQRKRHQICFHCGRKGDSVYQCCWAPKSGSSVSGSKHQRQAYNIATQSAVHTATIRPSHQPRWLQDHRPLHQQQPHNHNTIHNLHHPQRCLQSLLLAKVRDLVDINWDSTTSRQVFQKTMSWRWTSVVPSTN